MRAWVGWGLLVACASACPSGHGGGGGPFGGAPSQGGGGPVEQPNPDGGPPLTAVYRRSASPNPIPAENQLPGDAQWRAGISASRHQLELYTSVESVEAGGAVAVFVSTDIAVLVTAQVYRVGDYHGSGAREVWHGGPYAVSSQAACPGDPVTARVECAWSQSFDFTVSPSWVSGMYLVKLTRADGIKAFHPLVVRDHRAAEVLFQPAFNTYQAYNRWGGTSLYSDDEPQRTASGFAYEISYDRPYLEGEGAGQFFNYEYPFIRLLESQGYDITYGSNLDFSRTPDFAAGVGAFVAAGHDEYWTAEQRQQVDALVGAGKMSLAYFGADGAYWRVRTGADAHGSVLRTVICYKNESALDPVPGSTVRFRDDPNPLPENGLFGVQYDSYTLFGFPLVVRDPAHWLFAGTGVSPGTLFQGILGYEYDRAQDNGVSPAGQGVSAESPLISAEGVPGRSQAVDRVLSGGNTVFAAGSIYWSLALVEGSPLFDARVQRMTLNVLEHALSFRRPARSLSPAAGPVPAVPAPQGVPASTVAAFAGTADVPGSVDGSATAAHFSGPTALWVTPRGQVVVADTLGNQIRLIEPDASLTVRTIAGTGTLGYADGPGTQAMFRHPNGVAVSGAGVIFVADSDNHAIRALTPDGTGGYAVSTWAGGKREIGSADGPGTSARFNRPTGLAVDGQGALFVADQLNNKIRRVAPDAAHTVSTLELTFPTSDLGLVNPSALAASPGGDLFVVDASNERVCRIGSGSHRVSCIAGQREVGLGFRDGSGAVSRLRAQMGLLALPDGTLLVADTGNHRVRRIRPGADGASTVVTTLAGSGQVGTALGAALQSDLPTPSGLALLPDGRVLVSDPFHSVIRAIQP